MTILSSQSDTSLKNASTGTAISRHLTTSVTASKAWAVYSGLILSRLRNTKLEIEKNANRKWFCFLSSIESL